MIYPANLELTKTYPTWTFTFFIVNLHLSHCKCWGNRNNISLKISKLKTFFGGLQISSLTADIWDILKHSQDKVVTTKAHTQPHVSNSLICTHLAKTRKRSQAKLCRLPATEKLPWTIKCHYIVKRSMVASVTINKYIYN